ncbi:putative quinol monooxygenase [Agrobacterium deltaense]|uniref:putative quinol monooxygenase n=1 Tax=Agrobacterium deltaense TaxID=1183412 RepID=UPI003D9531CE
MKDKLFVVATIVAKKEWRSQLGDALVTLVPIAKTEPGFVQYDLHESIENPGTFVFYEIWEDESSLETHNNTPSMKAFGEKISEWVDSVKLEKFKLIS